MNYYTVVPEMSHKDSDLQVLITNGNFTWTEVARQKSQIHPRGDGDSPDGSQMSLIESQNGLSFDEDVMLPILRNINMQMSKVNFFLFLYYLVFLLYVMHHIFYIMYFFILFVFLFYYIFSFVISLMI